ncbi:MAG: hypothetical protein E7159_01090 [Firmicutes bacterium]|nr:hypothetical protein [Bacillota bacterium]
MNTEKINMILDKIKQQQQKNKQNFSTNITILVILLIFVIITVGSGSKKYETANNEIAENETTTITEKETLTITEKYYIEKVIDCVKKGISENDEYYYSGIILHDRYIEVGLYPKKKMKKEMIESEALKITKKILPELQKYEYKKGLFIKQNYDFVTFIFYGIDDIGEYTRGAGSWKQIEILKVNEMTENDIE